MKLAFLLILVFITSSVYSQKADNKAVVATVNNSRILKSELDTYHRSRLLQFSNRVITKRDSLQDLINREVALQKARRSGLDTVPAVRAQMENALYQAQIAKDLNEEFMKIKVSESDIKSYYNNHPEYKTSVILLRLPAQPSPEQVQTAYERAGLIYQQTRENPQNFDAIARKTSQLSVDINPNNPDIGYQPARQLSPEYFQAIKGKSVGTIVAPFRTQFGFNIVKVTGVKKYSEIDKDLYNAIIFDIRKQKIIDNYFAKLTDRAKIKVNEKLIK